MKNLIAFILVAALFFAGFVYFGIEPKVENVAVDNEEEKDEEVEEEVGTEKEEELVEESSGEEKVVTNKQEDKVNEALPEDNNKVVATFIGAIDGHSIEVKVDGGYQTFTFGEDLQDKIFSIESNKEVTITFETSDLGYKIIKTIEEN